MREGLPAEGSCRRRAEQWTGRHGDAPPVGGSWGKRYAGGKLGARRRWRELGAAPPVGSHGEGGRAEVGDRSELGGRGPGTGTGRCPRPVERGPGPMARWPAGGEGPWPVAWEGQHWCRSCIWGREGCGWDKAFFFRPDPVHRVLIEPKL
jgi:hypothetical protein